MLDKFTVQTQEGIKEIYGVAFKYYLDEEKLIIYATNDRLYIGYADNIIDWVENAAEDKEDAFYNKVKELYYERFKSTFINIASVIVQEKHNINECFN